MPHNHDHNHGHDDEPRRLTPGSVPQIESDPAMESLSEALNVSFRLLSVIMLLFVVLFLLTGITSIEAQEKGIKKVFGRVTEVVDSGFTYNWPFPIGEIEKVNTEERKTTVDAFWMHETAEDKAKELSERRRGSEEGLRPGWDGYLLTADRSLIHLRFIATYQVIDPVAVQANVQDVDAALKSILRTAAVEAAATDTAEALQRNHDEFCQEVKTKAQAALDSLLGVPEGVLIKNVLLPSRRSKIWPLAAWSAYEAAQRASLEKRAKINEAIGSARDTLIATVGEKHFVELVGEPSEAPAPAPEVQLPDPKPIDLIGQYERTRNALDAAKDPTEIARLTKQADVLARADRHGPDPRDDGWRGLQADRRRRAGGPDRRERRPPPGRELRPQRYVDFQKAREVFLDRRVGERHGRGLPAADRHEVLPDAGPEGRPDQPGSARCLREIRKYRRQADETVSSSIR